MRGRVGRSFLEAAALSEGPNWMGRRLGAEAKAERQTAYSTRCKPLTGSGGWYTGLGCAARRPSTWNLCCHTRCTQAVLRLQGEGAEHALASIRHEQLYLLPSFCPAQRLLTLTITAMGPGAPGEGVATGRGQGIVELNDLIKNTDRDPYGRADPFFHRPWSSP